jgi:hypothetical protein
MAPACGMVFVRRQPPSLTQVSRNKKSAAALGSGEEDV